MTPCDTSAPLALKHTGIRYHSALIGIILPVATASYFFQILKYKILSLRICGHAEHNKQDL